MGHDLDSAIILDFALPTVSPEQIALYQIDYLITQPVCRFDPAEATRRVCSARR